MKFFHVTGPDYQEGDDLLCREAMETERDIIAAWKFGEDAPDWFDRDVVCLFRDLDEAAEFMALYVPLGRMLAIDIPDEAIEARDVRLVKVDEGYDAIAWKIPAEYISVIP